MDLQSGQFWNLCLAVGIAARYGLREGKSTFRLRYSHMWCGIIVVEAE